MAAKQPEFDIYEAFIKDIKDTPVEILPPSEINDLIKIARSSTLSPSLRATARSEVYSSMMRLIPYAISKFAPRHLPPEDLVGEAFQTINSCINAFNPERGAGFTGYVLSALRYRLRSPRTIIDIDQPFSIPEEDKAYANYIKKAYSQAAQKAQADPSLQDWYEQTEANRRANKLPGTSFETFQALQTHTIQRPYLRGGKPISSGNIHTDSLDTSEGTVEEIIPDDSLTTQLDDFANQDKLKTDIPPLLASMSQRNRDIVLKHSSADDYSTQKNLSEVYDVSPTRISQIYNYQTDVMRRKLKKMGYTRNVIPD